MDNGCTRLLANWVEESADWRRGSVLGGVDEIKEVLREHFLHWNERLGQEAVDEGVETFVEIMDTLPYNQASEVMRQAAAAIHNKEPADEAAAYDMQVTRTVTNIARIETCERADREMGVEPDAPEAWRSKMRRVHAEYESAKSKLPANK